MRRRAEARSEEHSGGDGAEVRVRRATASWWLGRRLAFWVVVVSPLLVMVAAFLIGGILHLFGAGCVTYGNNPMALDNEIVCNDLGEIRSIVGWTALGLAILLLPVAAVTGAVGAWRARQRRSS